MSWKNLLDFDNVGEKCDHNDLTLEINYVLCIRHL
jgi:hypothetical protein